MGIDHKLHDWKDELKYNFLQDHSANDIEQLDDLKEYDTKEDL